MTPYSRGYAAALKAAADVCRKTGDTFGKGDHQTGAYVCQQKISRLPILGEATNPGEQVVRDAHTEDGSKHCVEPARPGPCVSVPVAMLEKWKDAIAPYWFSSDGEDEYNNDGVIEVSEEISELIAAAKEE